MEALTHREAELLKFLRAHTRANGIPPTVKEMRAGISLHSTSAIIDALDALVQKGRIRRLRYRARGIEVLPDADHHAPDCSCTDCAWARYAGGLQMVNAIRHEAPAAIMQATKTGFKSPSVAVRAQMLGVKLRVRTDARKAVAQ